MTWIFHVKRMQEQQLINQFHARFTRGEPVMDLVATIERDYKNSVILNYYLGYYYEKNGAFQEAEEKYLHCIKICPSFAGAYVNLGAYYMTTLREKEGEAILSMIFNKKTLDTSKAARTLIYDYQTQLRICSLLGPHYTRISDRKKAVKLYETMCGRIHECSRNMTYVLVEGWKNLCLGLGTVLMAFDPGRAYQHFLEGVTRYNIEVDEGVFRDMLQTLDQKLIQNALMVRSYCLDPKPFPLDVSKYFPGAGAIRPISPKHNKLRLGYLTPDLNKNAVGLFSTPLLKYFSRERFEVYVYYTNEKKDEFTSLFEGYPDINWFDVHGHSDRDLCRLIREDHEIDILVDMIAMGVGGRPGLISMGPSAMVVNYLGYPDSGFLPQYTHRITDRICDPSERTGYSEKLIHMPRCFICYHPFENIPIPEIAYRGGQGKVYVGVINKKAKHHPLVRNAWRTILEKKRNYVLCIKEEIDREMYADFPKDQILLLPHAETLPEYFDQLNKLDFCLDTYPYSGATTTSSCMYMGVPVLTIYKPSNHHVSNVSASIIRQSGDDHLICSTISEYVKKAVKFPLETQDARVQRRERFLKLMNGKRYMREFEDLLEKSHGGL
jgi:tetratricopeptide (TPR) repeat protein